MGLPYTPRGLSLAQILERHTDKSGGPEACWIWRGPSGGRGYGVLRYQNKRWAAHRMSWTQANGPIPTGMHMCHRCDNPPCVNPAHLYPGTDADNMRDRDSRGRSKKGRPQESTRKFTDEQVRAMFSDPRPQPVIAAEYGATQPYVSAVKLKKVRPHLWKKSDKPARVLDRGASYRHPQPNLCVLTDDQVRAIRLDARTRDAIAADYEISGAHVTNIKLRRRRTHVPDLEGFSS